MMSSPARGSLRAAARRFVRGRRGSVLVEFALVTPVLAILCCAIIDFSVYLFTLNNLTTVARQSARRLAMQRPVVPDTGVVWACRALTFKPPGVTCNSTLIQVQDHSTDSGYVRVVINGFPYTPMTPVAPLFGFTGRPIYRAAIFNWEYANP